VGIYADERDLCFVVNCQSVVGEGGYGMRVFAGSVIVMDTRLAGDLADVRIETDATLFAHGLQYETRSGAGILEAMQGDRSAWDVANYPARHASDISTGLEVYHNPAGAGVGQAPVWDGDEWAATDIATQSELGSHEGNPSAHHAPVTLAADADELLGLSGQELTLDSQDANTVFAGPPAGGALDPDFRALVDADIPPAIARDAEVLAVILAHEGASDPHPTYLTIAEHTAILTDPHGGGGHVHGLARWNGGAGDTIFELPDFAEYIDWVAYNGLAFDPGADYSLDVAGDTITLTAGLAAAATVTSGYVIAQA
jgi:hypothetical protein